jgi:hypothetical protein
MQWAISTLRLYLWKKKTFELYNPYLLQLFQLFLNATQNMCYLYVSSPNLLLQHYMQIVVYLVYHYNFVVYQGFDQLVEQFRFQCY